MEEAKFTNYQAFYERRSDLEDDGYTVESICNNDKGEFILRVERTSLVPSGMADLPEPFITKEGE